MTDADNLNAGSRGGLMPQFRLLPTEVRCLVWRHFVLLVTAKPRLLDFDIRRSDPEGDDRHPEAVTDRWVVVPGAYLSQRTRHLSNALRVNRESRFAGLGVVPDTLAIEHGVVRFDKTHDVVAISSHEVRELWHHDHFDARRAPFHERLAHFIIPGFSDNIHHLALKGISIGEKGRVYSLDEGLSGAQIWPLAATFRNLETLYELNEHYLHSPKNKTWCVAPGRVHSDEALEEPPMETHGRPWLNRTIWPDVARHHAWAKSHVYPPLRDLGQIAADFHRDGTEPGFVSWFQGVEIWPMLEFLGPEGQHCLAHLRGLQNQS
ncbi:uncharacterized protein PpBr36_10552 [Pyricularia pennisetigena]|uniref:uncharacterized protein n=1 Tax=Pyricularia pennisetigena TaxID=1578925 RepID=UPI00114D8751|nr:uncharacterized protein PpBr36_10552 [Pyricularia pennisetigena]TLS21174.1 hypothetical protein PpBr36_10552 [Pyricularia pennisetigena]